MEPRPPHLGHCCAQSGGTSIRNTMAAEPGSKWDERSGSTSLTSGSAAGARAGSRPESSGHAHEHECSTGSGQTPAVSGAAGVAAGRDAKTWPSPKEAAGTPKGPRRARRMSRAESHENLAPCNLGAILNQVDAITVGVNACSVEDGDPMEEDAGCPIKEQRRRQSVQDLTNLGDSECPGSGSGMIRTGGFKRGQAHVPYDKPRPPETCGATGPERTDDSNTTLRQMADGASTSATGALDRREGDKSGG